MFASKSTDIGSDLPLWAVQDDFKPGVGTVTAFMGGWNKAYAKQYHLGRSSNWLISCIADKGLSSCINEPALWRVCRPGLLYCLSKCRSWSAKSWHSSDTPTCEKTSVEEYSSVCALIMRLSFNLQVNVFLITKSRFPFRNSDESTDDNMNLNQFLLYLLS